MKINIAEGGEFNIEKHDINRPVWAIFSGREGEDPALEAVMFSRDNAANYILAKHPDPEEDGRSLVFDGCWTPGRFAGGNLVVANHYEVDTHDALDAAIKPATTLEREETDDLSPVIRDVLAERAKQVAKGYDAAHDDGHTDGEIANAAAWMAVDFECRELRDNVPNWVVNLCDKTPTRREDLVIAAALLIAEIERLDRAAK